jgi:hypothetical protein
MIEKLTAELFLANSVLFAHATPVAESKQAIPGVSENPDISYFTEMDT